jgi:type IV fimbrial biogenesis protein FimT
VLALRKLIQQAGTSLVELVVVLAIALTLCAVALPDMRRLIRQFRLNATVTDLYSALERTRAEAIARGSRVMLLPAAADGADWSEGWIVLVDRDGDRRPGAGDEVLGRHAAPGDGILITSVFTGQKAPYYIAFNAAGRSCSATSSVAARWGSLSVSDGDGTRRIRINMLGRARICDPARDGASCGEAE